MSARRVKVVGVAAALALVACTGSREAEGAADAPAARALIDAAAEAMGGWEALAAIGTQEVVTVGSDWEPMQATRLGEERLINTFRERLFVDYRVPALRLDFVADRTWPTQTTFRFTEVMDTDAGMLEEPGAGGAVERSRLNPGIHATRLRDLNRLPARVLAVARDAPGLEVGDDQEVDGRRTRVVHYRDSGLATELHLDAATSLPARVVSLEDDPLFGDTRNEIIYEDWRSVGEEHVLLPHRFELLLNDLRFRQGRVQEWVNNPTLPRGTFDIPAEIRGQAEGGERLISYWPIRRAVMGTGYEPFARPQTVELHEAAPGVLHVRGAGQHSMAVEMDDFLVVVEMPAYEERSLAVIEALEERFPGKPIRYGVVTHFHMDHSGGVRTYAAEGATILVHELSAPFFREVLERPKTVRPDVLARGGAKGRVEPVSTQHEISDGTRTVRLLHVPNPHADDMLIAHLPNERIVFVTDLYSPGGTISPDDPRFHRLVPFYRFVVDAGLEVDQVLGGHGGTALFSDVDRVLRPLLAGPSG